MVLRKNECINCGANSIFFLYKPRQFCYLTYEIWKLLNCLFYRLNAVKQPSSKQFRFWRWNNFILHWQRLACRPLQRNRKRLLLTTCQCGKKCTLATCTTYLDFHTVCIIFVIPLLITKKFHKPFCKRVHFVAFFIDTWSIKFRRRKSCVMVNHTDLLSPWQFTACVLVVWVSVVSHRNYEIIEQSMSNLTFAVYTFRYDVVLKADQLIGNYWMHVVGTGDCVTSRTSQTAIIRYESAMHMKPSTGDSYDDGIRTGLVSWEKVVRLFRRV